jgi:hypothetical protein
MRGKGTCHMHRGKSKGAISAIGKEKSRKAALRHGVYTKEFLLLHKEAMSLIRKSKNLIAYF